MKKVNLTFTLPAALLIKEALFGYVFEAADIKGETEADLAEMVLQDFCKQILPAVEDEDTKDLLETIIEIGVARD